MVFLDSLQRVLKGNTLIMLANVRFVVYTCWLMILYKSSFLTHNRLHKLNSTWIHAQYIHIRVDYETFSHTYV